MPHKALVFLTTLILSGGLAACASNNGSSNNDKGGAPAGTPENAPKNVAAAWTQISLQEMTDEVRAGGCESEKFSVFPDGHFMIQDCQATRDGQLSADELNALKHDLDAITTSGSFAGAPNCHGQSLSKTNYIDLTGPAGVPARLLSEDIRGICIRGDFAKVRALEELLRTLRAARGSGGTTTPAPSAPSPGTANPAR